MWIFIFAICSFKVFKRWSWTCVCLWIIGSLSVLLGLTTDESSTDDHSHCGDNLHFHNPWTLSKWKIHGEGGNSNAFDCSGVLHSGIHSWCASQLKETAVRERCWHVPGVPSLSLPNSWHAAISPTPARISLSFWPILSPFVLPSKKCFKNNALEMLLWRHAGIWCKYDPHNLFTPA